jgi:hypothetical protein
MKQKIACDSFFIIEDIDSGPIKTRILRVFEKLIGVDSDDSFP